MSFKFNVGDDVKELITDIIAKNNWKSVTDVKYYPGTDAGDGFATKHVSVDIISENKRIRLFVKCSFDIPDTVDTPVKKFYSNEAYFYNVIYPAYSKFLERKCIENSFLNIPRCYGTSVKNTIALEDLKENGFTVFEKQHAMNNKHISLVLKTLAKFHAISFAFKDQDREGYDKLAASANQDFMGAQSQGRNSQIIRMVEDMISDGLRKLDPVIDKDLLEKCNLGDLLSTIINVEQYLNEYSILIQGDCWCNNIMFLYEKEEKENPTDVILIDWQLIRTSSPILDISYFFYSIANEDALSKLDFYLTEYYDELSNQIGRLGSDPKRLYPLSVFQNQWKLYSKYGFAMSFLLIKLMLVKTEEVIKFEEADLEEFSNSDTVTFFTEFQNEPEYIRRLRVLGKCMMKNDYL